MRGGVGAQLPRHCMREACAKRAAGAWQYVAAFPPHRRLKLGDLLLQRTKNVALPPNLFENYG